MNEREAKERCKRLAEEHPHREIKFEGSDDSRLLPPWLDPPRGGIV